MNEFKIYNSEMPKPIPYKYIKENHYTPLHLHKEIELIYLFCDNWIIHIESNIVSGNDECLFIINCNELHSISANNFIKLSIPPDFFPNGNLNNISFINKVYNDKVLKNLFYILKSYSVTNEKESSLITKSTVYKILSHIIKNYKLKENINKEKKNKLIYEILDYIGLNYNENITTKNLSEVFHLNEVYFCNLFKKSIGVSPVNYINKLRCEKAANMLINSESTISEIAYQAGFSSSNYFSRTFKKIIKKSPSEFRKANLK